MTTDSTPTPAEPLKPCPLCGKSAHFFKISDLDSREHGGEGICCETDGCAQVGLMWSLMEDAKPLLAERWNRRATPAAAAEIAQPATHAEVLTDEQCDDLFNRYYRGGFPWRRLIRAALATQAAQQPKDVGDAASRPGLSAGAPIPIATGEVPGVTADVVAAALLLKEWAATRNEPNGWHIAGIGRVK